MLRSFLSACLLATPAFAEPPRVVTDIPPVHALVKGVMGDLAEPKALLSGGASPHDYAFRPSDARALTEADLVIWVGEGLTPWLEDALHSLADDVSHLELMTLDQTYRREFEDADGDHHDEEHADDHGEEHADHHGEEHADHHGEEHSEDHGEEHADHHGEEHADEHGHGHAHDGDDPHVWLDPGNAIAWLPVIADALSKLDGENAEIYQSNATALAADLVIKDQQIATKLSAYHDARLLFLHDAFGYFIEHYDLQSAGAVSDAEATDPSPAQLSRLREDIRERNVTCAFAEPQFDTALLETALEGTSVNIGRLDPLGSELETGWGYGDLLEALSASIETCVQQAS